MTKAYTRALCARLIGNWVTQRGIPVSIYKAVSSYKKGHRLVAIEFGSDQKIDLKTRKFRLATDAEVAAAVAARLQGPSPYVTGARGLVAAGMALRRRIEHTYEIESQYLCQPVPTATQTMEGQYANQSESLPQDSHRATITTFEAVSPYRGDDL